MAVQKCPYCKALIEEGSEFCSNCGTKLIFPEDENIEEEIPGEEIADTDEQEEDFPEENEDIESVKESAETGDTENRLRGDYPEEPEMPEKTPSSSDEDESQEEESETEKKDTSNGGIETPEIPEPSETPPEDIPSSEETEEEMESNWLFPEKGPDKENEEETESIEEKERDTQDLEETADPADKEKEEIERFLDSLKKERREIKERIKDVEEEIPPWAEKIREEDKPEGEAGAETVPEPKDEEEEEETGALEEISEDKPEIGIEETPDFTGYNQGMLFGSAEEGGRERKRINYFAFLKPPRWLKSRLFDVLLIAGLWLVSFGIAAYLTETGIFSLIAASVLPAAGFFVILTAVYFGLFLVFLRETLGDFIFPKEE